MKRLLIIVLVVMATIAFSVANARSMKAMRSPVTGIVADSAGAPVAYATVIALQDRYQAAGTVTDDNGAFSLSLDNGSYTLSFEFLGYRSVEKTVKVDGPLALGTVVLEDDDVKIERVEVTAQIIRREADRFVVDVANMPSAIGKDGVELLQTSPGVFINDDKITINGQSGTKVYVNEREVRYTGDRLLTYLRSLKTEEIQKIEVVPIAGADQDADSAGGIIKITLRQKRDDGFMGNVGFYTGANDLLQRFSPSANFDYRTGKWTVSASGNYSYNGSDFMSDEKTAYSHSDDLLESHSQMLGRMGWYNAKVGAVYEVDDCQSVGAEVEYSGYKDSNKNTTWSRFAYAQSPTVDESNGIYDNRSRMNNVTGRFNYIAKLDTLGSIVKVLADYTHQQSSSHNDYATAKSTIFDGSTSLRDSLYRDNSGTNYDIATISVGYEKVFSPKFTIKTGGKYTLNMMKSFSDYDLLNNDTSEWITRPTYNYDVDYTENIGALYAIGVAKFGRWGITAGLRGEYTNTSGRGNVARQNYFSLFPNANVSFALTKDQSYMLIGQYSRNIERPNFWSLNPARMQISEYTYQIGNPNLSPSYFNYYSLSLVMKYKYTVTFMANIGENEIQQVVLIDDENPNISYLSNENLYNVENYGVAVNLPFQFTKWWSANFNCFGGYFGTRINKGDSEIFHPMMNYSTTMTFTLPAQFYLNLEYFGRNSAYIANIKVNGVNNLSLSVKKRLFKDKLSLSAGVRNIIPEKQNITYLGDGFERKLVLKQGWNRPQLIFSVSYNFNTGKNFSKKSIESDADTGRLAK